MGRLSGFTMLFYGLATFLLAVIAYVTAANGLGRGDELGSWLITGSLVVMVVGPVVFLAAAAGAVLVADHDAGPGERTTR